MNKILTLVGRTIPYVKELQKIEGVDSVTACILMQQLDYRFEQKPDGFYKFLQKPDEPNSWYREGDSWCEELGFSVYEFRTAFDKIGKRYSSKTEFNSAVDKFDGKYYCSYIDGASNLTYYFRNHKLIDSKLNELVLSNFRDGQSPSPEIDKTHLRDGQSPSQRLIKPISGDGENPSPITDITRNDTDITTENNIVVNLTNLQQSTIPKKKERKKRLCKGEKEELQDAAISLVEDYKAIVEKPHLSSDADSYRVKKIMEVLRLGATFDDFRLAYRGAVTDKWLKDNGIVRAEDIQWLCEKNPLERIERYKALAIKRGLTPDAAIRKSLGYKPISTTKERDFATKPRI